MSRDPRLILKYLDFRFQEFDLHRQFALKAGDVPLDQAGDIVEDPGLWSAVQDARILWARALRLTAAERERLLLARKEQALIQHLEAENAEAEMGAKRG